MSTLSAPWKHRDAVNDKMIGRCTSECGGWHTILPETFTAAASHVLPPTPDSGHSFAGSGLSQRRPPGWIPNQPSQTEYHQSKDKKGKALEPDSSSAHSRCPVHKPTTGHGTCYVPLESHDVLWTKLVSEIVGRSTGTILSFLQLSSLDSLSFHRCSRRLRSHTGEIGESSRKLFSCWLLVCHRHPSDANDLILHQFCDPLSTINTSFVLTFTALLATRLCLTVGPTPIFSCLFRSTDRSPQC